MNNLIIYFSRTGNTKIVANYIEKITGWNTEEIKEETSRLGILGYLFSGRDATLKKIVKIEPLKYEISKYDLIIIGTPVWAYNMSAPVRTFLYENKNMFKKVAFFCTMGGDGSKQTFVEMEKVCSIKPITTVEFTENEIKHKSFEEKVKEFVKKL